MRVFTKPQPLLSAATRQQVSCDAATRVSPAWEKRAVVITCSSSIAHKKEEESFIYSDISSSNTHQSAAEGRVSTFKVPGEPRGWPELTTCSAHLCACTATARGTRLKRTALFNFRAQGAPEPLIVYLLHSCSGTQTPGRSAEHRNRRH